MQQRGNLVATSAMVGRICPHPLVGIGGLNLGPTVVVPVAPMDTCLSRYLIEKIGCLEIEIYRSGQQSRIEN